MDKYLIGLENFVRNAVGHCESRPWAGHTLGYVMIPLGEGLTDLSTNGNFYVRSPATEAAWRTYVTQKYGTDAAVRTA